MSAITVVRSKVGIPIGSPQGLPDSHNTRESQPQLAIPSLLKSGLLFVSSLILSIRVWMEWPHNDHTGVEIDGLRFSKIASCFYCSFVGQ
jgi:hypothetical protein